MIAEQTSLAPHTPVRKTVLPREGKYWLGAFVCLWVTGWVKGINLILLLSYLLLALWILNWIIARRSLRGLHARRLAIDPVFAGTPTTWQVEVADNGRRSLPGWELLDSSSAHSVHWFVENLQPGECARLRGQVHFPHRGTFPCMPLRAVSSYPFGLARQEVSFGQQDDVTIYPAIGAIDIQRLRRWLDYSARPDERTRRSRRKLTQEMEFHGLRSFQHGDSPRWIHWRTSARKGELMVREFDQGTHHDLLLIVEVMETSQQSSPVEAAISLAATIAWFWALEAGDRIVLAIAGESNVVLDPSEGRQNALRMLTALAQTRPVARPDLTRLAVELESQASSPGPLLLVTSRPDSWSADFLERRLNRPVARLSPSEPLNYYQPPRVVPVA